MSATRGRVSARALTCALVLASLLLACGAAGARAATVPADFYGVNAGAPIVDDPAARPAALATMRAGGLSFVRADASWTAIEPSGPVAGVHTYDWAKFDGFVADLARNGLRWYPMLGYSAPWATSVAGDPFASPTGDASYASFAAAFAARYGSGGSFWTENADLPRLPVTVYGIWNEPSNSEFWHGPEATPARYMSLYLAARAAIKAVDAAARVTTAGLLDSGTVDGHAYLRAMLDAAGAARTQVDAVDWHPYVGELDQIMASIKTARTTLDAYGMKNTPLEISEVGWHTGYDATQRAAWLRSLAAKLPSAGLGVTRLLPFVWTGHPEWQITNADGSAGPIAGAYFAGIRDALAPQPVSATVAAATTSTTGAAKKAAKKSCRTKTRKTAAGRKTTRRCVAKKAKKAGPKARAATRKAAAARRVRAHARARVRAAAARRTRAAR